MELIHYGAKEFNANLFSKVRNREPLWVKPTGGFWCSPVNSKYGWVDFCSDEGFNEDGITDSFTFSLYENSRVYVIDTSRDLLNIAKLIIFKNLFIDFEDVATKYDAIHLTINGQRETRFNYGCDLYGWDCESVLILNKNCIKLKNG